MPEAEPRVPQIDDNELAIFSPVRIAEAAAHVARFMRQKVSKLFESPREAVDSLLHGLGDPNGEQQ